MGFFTEEELEHIRIERMNFQIVGEDAFTARPPMRHVEQSDFFLGRIRDIDVGSAYAFEEGSEFRRTIEHVAAGTRGFAPGAEALARDFHSRHVGQAKAGALFFFELATQDESTRIYALLKYDYNEVLTPQRRAGAEQLRRIVQAFVKDKRALQKSALVRVVDGRAESMISVRDRTEVSPKITDFFTAFLGVSRSRDDVELNKAASEAIGDIVKSAPPNTWPDGAPAALRALRLAVRNCPEISVEAIHDFVHVVAGRPADDDQANALKKLTERVWRRQGLLGLNFHPHMATWAVASSRRIHTIEHIKLEFPEALDGVKVHLKRLGDGTVEIIIQTARIDSDVIINESLGSIRQRIG